jgi:hypothetical protein
MKAKAILYPLALLWAFNSAAHRPDNTNYMRNVIDFSGYTISNQCYSATPSYYPIY